MVHYKCIYEGDANGMRNDALQLHLQLHTASAFAFASASALALPLFTFNCALHFCFPACGGQATPWFLCEGRNSK
jgi:hypothetical protein